MQREIKFRAWVHSYCGGGIPQECYNTMDYSDNYQGNLSDFFSLYNPLFFSVMQYTGLKDKNGKEIYEGDIIQFTQCLFNTKEENYPVKTDVVKYDKHSCSFTVDPTRAGRYNIEVIGNIYENPELIKNEKI